MLQVECKKVIVISNC